MSKYHRHSEVGREISIVIPTRNRAGHLFDCLRSIPSDINIIVICDGDLKTKRHLESRFKNVKWIIQPKRIGSVKCRNMAIRDLDTHVIYATDDVIFSEVPLRLVQEILLQRPDLVIGFHQVPNSFHESGVAAIGSEFLKRYPLKMPFCPIYEHFAAHEVAQLARATGRFMFDSDIFLQHKSVMHDKTARDARISKHKDRAKSDYRSNHGIIWGLNKEVDINIMRDCGYEGELYEHRRS